MRIKEDQSADPEDQREKYKRQAVDPQATRDPEGRHGPETRSGPNAGTDRPKRR